MIKQIKELEISYWISVMSYMYNRREELNLNRTAYKLDITYAYLSNIFTFFENKGWIIRKDIDNRSRVAYLTEEGEKIAKKCSELLFLIKRS